MQHQAGSTMLSKLLGLLVLCSVSSAMIAMNKSMSMGGYYDDYGSGDDSTYTMSIPPDMTSPDPTDDRMRSLIGGPMPPQNEDFCDMILNSQPPVNPIPPMCLCQLCKGTTGPKGDCGDRGPPGEPGSPGRRGIMGFRGRPGFTGSQGIKGQKGDLGEKGQSGAMGFNGVKGSRGFKGEKGDRGLEGPPGTQGPQGESGSCPASCESVQGPPGSQGPTGPAGGRGLPGVKGAMGQKGHRGDKGDLGIPGNPGTDGQKGDQGDQGVCECTDGERGADGIQGAKGDTGEKGDTGPQGMQGADGAKGNQGMPGMMGMPGPCTPAVKSAFSALLNTSYPIKNWPVAFTNVLYNMQEHFNPNMGIYTAPVNGTYLFSLNLAVKDKPLKVGLFRNFIPVLKATEGSSISTVSQVIILHLDMLDQVWLQVKDETSNGMYTARESTSTFSGVLLFPDSCEYPMNRNAALSPTGTPTEGFNWGD